MLCKLITTVCMCSGTWRCQSQLLGAAYKHQQLERGAREISCIVISAGKCTACVHMNHFHVQIVFAVLGCWGVGIYSAIKIFGGKKESAPAAAPEQLDKH